AGLRGSRGRQECLDGATGGVGVLDTLRKRRLYAMARRYAEGQLVAELPPLSRAARWRLAQITIANRAAVNRTCRLSTRPSRQHPSRRYPWAPLWPRRPWPAATRARRSCSRAARPATRCRTAPTDRESRTLPDGNSDRISRQTARSF